MQSGLAHGAPAARKASSILLPIGSAADGERVAGVCVAVAPDHANLKMCWFDNQPAIQHGVDQRQPGTCASARPVA